MKVINNKKGFTLVELLVVVAIIGILASVGVVSFQGYTKMAKKRVLVANWLNISKVIRLELAAANNGLDSFIPEYDEDGNFVSEKMDGNTTCNNFAFSVQQHFSHFKNPYNREWDSVTVDTLAQSQHRKGQIQLVCYSHFGSFGDGGGCPISSDACRLLLIAYIEDRGRWNTPDGKCDNTIVSTSNDGWQRNASEHRNDCFYQILLGGDQRESQAQQQSDCGWNSSIHGPWIVTQNSIRDEAGGKCSGSSGTPCS